VIGYEAGPEATVARVRSGGRVATVPVSSGPADAVTALYTDQYTRMLRLAAVLLSEPWAAEDVVQDAFVGLYAAWERLRDKDAAIGYLHRSVVNGARSRGRRRVTALRHRPAPPPDAASAEDAVLAAWHGGPVAAALRALPRREREVVLLRYYLDLSERQAADALGVSVGSVKAYASRGIAGLRRALAPALVRIDPYEREQER
jgi:RNA polymerase sigma-70 factor (sigma-E family)